MRSEGDPGVLVGMSVFVMVNCSLGLGGLAGAAVAKSVAPLLQQTLSMRGTMGWFFAVNYSKQKILPLYMPKNSR